MSYEGFVRMLCANGHQRVCDCWDEEPEQCSCGEGFVWRRSVDTTNGYDEASEQPLEIAVPAVTQTCDMGHAHVVQEARYVIPDKR